MSDRANLLAAIAQQQDVVAHWHRAVAVTRQALDRAGVLYEETVFERDRAVRHLECLLCWLDDPEFGA